MRRRPAGADNTAIFAIVLGVDHEQQHRKLRERLAYRAPAFLVRMRVELSQLEGIFEHLKGHLEGNPVLFEVGPGLVLIPRPRQSRRPCLYDSVYTMLDPIKAPSFRSSSSSSDRISVADLWRSR